MSYRHKPVVRLVAIIRRALSQWLMKWSSLYARRQKLMSVVEYVAVMKCLVNEMPPGTAWSSVAMARHHRQWRQAGRRHRYRHVYATITATVNTRNQQCAMANGVYHGENGNTRWGIYAVTAAILAVTAINVENVAPRQRLKCHCTGAKWTGHRYRRRQQFTVTGTPVNRYGSAPTREYVAITLRTNVNTGHEYHKH